MEYMWINAGPPQWKHSGCPKVRFLSRIIQYERTAMIYVPRRPVQFRNKVPEDHTSFYPHERDKLRTNKLSSKWVSSSHSAKQRHWHWPITHHPSIIKLRQGKQRKQNSMLFPSLFCLLGPLGVYLKC